MPLPTGGKQPWPPAEWEAAYAEMAVTSAWYSGDPDRLAAAYGGGGGQVERQFFGPPSNRPSTYRGGLVGMVARAFWGAPTPAGEKPMKLHVPLAGDLASLSADLLFSEPPSFDIEDDEATEARLRTIVDESGLHATLLEGAEVQSPLGGVYLVATWDGDHATWPWLRVVHADAAVPEFRWGRLSAVTFWRVVAETGGKVWRHLERHEPGRILHGLYQGEHDQLGMMVPLESMPETERLAPEVPTGIAELTAEYVPNVRPNRLDRSSPLGRSDFSPGIITLMDALDETYTSWMRDIDLGKARLIVPETYLQHNGPGRGSTFDADRRIFTPVSGLLPAAGEMPIEQVQFAIRVAEHADTADRLVAQIVRGCGWSLQSLGETATVATTATEVNARERRSFITRDKKALYWRAGLQRMLHALLQLDATHFGSQVTAQPPKVRFGDSVQESMLAVAQTVSALAQAEAASTEVKVRMVHPDWDAGDVDAEVARILAERGMAAPPAPDVIDLGGEPGQIGVDGADDMDPADVEPADPAGRAD